jgi:hypothetical protein
MTDDFAPLLAARAAEAKANPAAVCTWDEVVAEVRRPQ